MGKATAFTCMPRPKAAASVMLPLCLCVAIVEVQNDIWSVVGFNKGIL